MVGNVVLGWIGGVLSFMGFLWLIVGNILRFVYWIKCLKIEKPCKNMDCRFRHLCDKYDNKKEILELRIKLLQKKIKEMEQ